MKLTEKPGRLLITLDTSWEGKTIQDFLDYYLLSKKHAYLLLQDSTFTCNHQTVTRSTILHKQDELQIPIPKEPLGFLQAENECPVVYEDALVYVAHKQPGIIVHGEENDSNALANQAACFQENHGIFTPVRYIHRLDKDTTGLVLFVKVPFFQAWFDQALAKKQILRHYYALCVGTCSKGKSFTFNDPIGKDRHINGKYRISQTGKSATTKAKCIDVKDNLVLLSCTLETGRTHQIRVHCAAHGLPICNDVLYGVRDSHFETMGLWADQIQWKNPVTLEQCIATDFPNPDFQVFKQL